jgi:hypothetical protein
MEGDIMRRRNPLASTKKLTRPAVKRASAKRAIDPLVSAKVRFAYKVLMEGRKLAGARSRRLSARVDPGLIEAARQKTGIANNSDLINAALAVIAAPDDFGPWFAAQAGRLPPDFELDL